MSPPFQPMLVSNADSPPLSSEWTFEPGYDGLRAIVAVQSRDVRIWSASGYDLTWQFPEFHNLHDYVCPVVLDCEIVSLASGSRPRIGLSACSSHTDAGLIACDVLRVGNRIVIDCRIEERRGILENLIPADLPALSRSSSFTDSDALLRKCEERVLRSIVAKRKGSRYHPGARTGEWLKCRAQARTG